MSGTDRTSRVAALETLLRSVTFPSEKPRAIVAIPVCNEEDRLAACLASLVMQVSLCGALLCDASFGLVLLFNNCIDRSVAVARRHLERTGLPVILAQVQLQGEQANAGWARGLALDLAALWLERRRSRDGILLTTDADSRVPNDWVAHNLAAIERGCDGVAGQVVLESSEEASLPLALIHRGRIESAYERALLALSARLDPLPHDPWPNHWTSSGASLAVTLRAYRAIGGLPLVACGEDRALVSALMHKDLRIRHDPNIKVVTSARLVGRAQGGTADAMRLRCSDPDVPGDDCLEPFLAAMRRYLWRRKLRWSHANGRLHEEVGWRRALRLPAKGKWDAPSFFGALWSHVEANSPPLAKVALRPSEMPAHAILARAALRVLGPLKSMPGPDSPDDNPPSGLSVLHEDEGLRLQ
jgi:GT2 family glycosyltransferase